MDSNVKVDGATSSVQVVEGDAIECLKKLPDELFQAVITSPPYWGVRDYGVSGQLGAERELAEYVDKLVLVFAEARRVLRRDGVCWLNIGNTYTSGGRKWRDADDKNKGRGMSYRPPTPSGLKKKDLIGVAWMVALACQRDGWYLRNDVVWHKPNCQPESVKDRLTVSHEYLFLMTKSEKYFFSQDPIMEQTTNGIGRKNRRTVWSINTEANRDAHYAVFPRELVRPCVLSSTKPNDLILDPFFGTGTVGIVAAEMGRRCIGIELNGEYARVARMRTKSVQAVLTQAV